MLWLMVAVFFCLFSISAAVYLYRSGCGPASYLRLAIFSMLMLAIVFIVAWIV